MIHQHPGAFRATIVPAARLMIALAIVLSLLLSPTGGVSAAGGDLVPGFGIDGVMWDDPTNDIDNATRTIVLPDGKILVGSTTMTGDYATAYIVFARYESDGDLDTTFGLNGYSTVNYGPGWTTLVGMALTPDGRIVSAGMYMTPTGATREYIFVRLCPDGQRDTGGNCPELQPKFGTDGIVLVQAQEEAPFDQSYAQAVAVYPDNRIIAGGESGDSGQRHKFSLVRLTSDGSLDTTFDLDGIVTTEVGLFQDEIYSVLIDQNDKVVAAGFSADNDLDLSYFAIARYNEDGSLDTSFDSDGIVTTLVGEYSSGNFVKELSDGKLLVGGNAYTDYVNYVQGFAVARYNPDGSLDASFGSGGTVIEYFNPDLLDGSFSTMLVDAHDRIVVGGTAYTDATWSTSIVGLARLCPDGDLDIGQCSTDGFGGDGRVLLSPGDSASPGIRSLAMNADGDYLVGGSDRFSGLDALTLVMVDSGDINGFTISGNAGTPGATLSYTDGTPKTVTADGSGSYTLTVSPGWSGTVTPSKTGYTFSPASIPYSSVSANQTVQNYTATPITYTISGNAGAAGATLSYTDGSAKTATADGDGNYSFTVSYNWTGTVTPSLTGYTFDPENRGYTNVLANQTDQDFTPTAITYTITGNAGTAGATLSYTDGSAKTATTDGAGNYTLTVSYNWSGTVTPSLTGYRFTPASTPYTNVLSNRTAQNYAAEPVTYTISGNAGMSGVTLSYTDGTAKTVTSGSDGSYTFTVSYNWSGTVTPSRTGYTFAPANREYTSLLASQSSQDFTPSVITYTLSGSVGVAGVTLSYTDGTPKTVTSDSQGNYSITVPYGWSSTITPSLAGYTFNPADRLYGPVTFSQSNQNFTPTAITYTVSGNAGIAGATLSYTDGTAKTATAGSDGSYSFTVSYNWSGTVTPSLAGYAFTPANRVYSNVLANQTGQNYTAEISITYTISGSAGVGGAVLSYTDGTPKTVTAGETGAYSLTVPHGWSGTVTPARAGYTFSPASHSYTNVTGDQAAQDFTAEAITFTISGNTIAAGVTLTYTDGTVKTVTSDEDGNYTLDVSYNWSGSITPSLAGFTFDPASLSFSNVLANQTGQDFELHLAAPVLKPVAHVLGWEFTIQWEPCTGADGYFLDVATDAEFTQIAAGFEDSNVGGVGDTSYTVTGLDPHTHYYFRLRASSGSVVSENSQTGEATTHYVQYYVGILNLR